jgi:SRSO17 transposase
MLEAGRAEQKLAELMGRLGPQLARVEPFQQAGKYVRGLMSDLPRKNCWTLAEYAGDRTPDRMQRLLERASWNTFTAMATVRDFVVEHLADEGGLTVLVLDESGDEKTGTHTAGVKRQYVGCAGKVANAVNFVNATYSTPRGRALVGSRLYVPTEHLADEQVRTQMGIPASLEFKTKPELGLELLAECLTADVRVPWCTADAVYGRDRKLRGFCERTGIGYALGVPCSFQVSLAPGITTRSDATLKFLNRRAWQMDSVGRAPKASAATPGHGWAPPPLAISC